MNGQRGLRVGDQIIVTDTRHSYEGSIGYLHEFEPERGTLIMRLPSCSCKLRLVASQVELFNEDNICLD